MHANDRIREIPPNSPRNHSEARRSPNRLYGLPAQTVGINSHIRFRVTRTKLTRLAVVAGCPRVAAYTQLAITANNAQAASMQAKPWRT